jgi:hypothetical protein
MHSAFHVGQPPVANGVTEGETFMVEAKHMQDRGVPVVDEG